ncbi:MAG: NAD(P)/FAD-dependent oxidoreductase, partial [Candidatus Bathyarchaeia archaeon]
MKRSSVVVIGGGCIGASIVYHLAKLGARNVTLVERSHLAWGSTGKSAAIVRQHYSHEVTARMALEGLRFFQNFGKETGLPTGFHNTGFVLIANEVNAEAVKQNVEMQ